MNEELKPMTNQERIDLILRAVEGLKSYEWGKISQAVHIAFSMRASKLQLDGSEKEWLRDEIAKLLHVTPQQSE